MARVSPLSKRLFFPWLLNYIHFHTIAFKSHSHNPKKNLDQLPHRITCIHEIYTASFNSQFSTLAFL